MYYRPKSRSSVCQENLKYAELIETNYAQILSYTPELCKRTVKLNAVETKMHKKQEEERNLNEEIDHLSCGSDVRSRTLQRA